MNILNVLFVLFITNIFSVPSFNAHTEIDNRNSIDVQQNNESCYIAAENGVVNLPMEVRNDKLAIDGKYVFAGGDENSFDNMYPSGNVKFQVDLTSGTFKIWCRVIMADGLSDSYWVQVDDNQPIKWKGQKNPTEWEWLPVVENNKDVTWNFVEPATHTITISLREPGAKIDEIYITCKNDIPNKGDELSSQDIKQIYISNLGNDIDNEGDNLNSPIRSLSKAYEIVHNNIDNYKKFEIYLHRGETFENFKVITSAVLSEGETDRNTFAFIWDINRELVLESYGEGSMPKLYGNRYRHEGYPTSAIGVCSPSTKKVVIKDIFIERFETCAINIYETQNVEVLNCKINEIGTHYFFSPDYGGIATDGGEQMREGMYVAGVVYPKNSNNIIIDGLAITNCHNATNDETNLHGFYCTRLSDSEIKNCYLKNISGSPLKFRRSGTHDVHVFNNEFYYTGHTDRLGYAQPGWIRYSGDEAGGCPYAIVIENNVFHYPYCISTLEDCGSAQAIKYSISNTTICGSEACEIPANITWLNNDFIYQWQIDSETAINNTNSNNKDFFIYDLFANTQMNEYSLKIDFNKRCKVSIYIADELGRSLRFILQNEYVNDNSIFKIKGNDMNKGLYYCCVQINGIVESVKPFYVE